MAEKPEDLFNELHRAATESRFPVWCTDSDLAITGAMRASGLTYRNELALVFEAVEYSPGEGVIQTLASCFSTQELGEWIRPGETLLVSEDILFDLNSGEPRMIFGIMPVSGRTRSAEIEFTIDRIQAGGYPSVGSPPGYIQALTYLVCDSLPRDELFSTPDFLQEAFDLHEDYQRLFAIDRWHHPGPELYESERIRLEGYPDLKTMVYALAAGRSQPVLTGTPNTFWQAHV